MKQLFVVLIIVLIYQQWRQVDAAEVNQQHGADVVMYTTSWCGYCAKARELLNSQRVPFVELDIERSAEANAEMKSLGGHGVPVIVVKGEVIKGFDQRRLQALINGL